MIAKRASTSAIRNLFGSHISSQRTTLPRRCLRSYEIRRHASSTTGPTPHFWTSGRAVLFATFTASLTYLFGVADAKSLFQKSKTSEQKPTYADQKDIENALNELRTALGENAVSTDEDELHRHGFSEWAATNEDRAPNGVVYPRSTEEVSQIAKVCTKYRVPMIGFAGGSSIESNFSAPHGGISIDFANMDKVLALHANDLDVVVQPSVPWMKLNEIVKDDGLFFPVDPSPTAQIGGMVATGCSGTNAVRWGTMRDWVVNLTVVLADGTVIKTRRRPRKSSAGYNLTHLFVGSEGTLGLITEITLKLAVIPQETSVAVVDFPNVRAAAAAAQAVMRAGVPIGAMEIMDDVQMGCVNKAGSTKRKWKEVPTMFFKFSGTEAGVRENIKLVERISKENGCGQFSFATTQEEKDDLWSARKEALWSAIQSRDEEDLEIYTTDVAVPLSALPDLIEMTQRDLKATGVFGATLGHIGDGNFHATILFKKTDDAQRAAVKKCVRDMLDRALELDGTCTGEHGVGLVKKEGLLLELGEDTVNTMKNIKRALDPKLLLNPGKIVDF